MVIQCQILNGSYAVCRFEPQSALPDWVADAQGFVSVTRTDDELSIMCESAVVPSDTEKVEHGYRMLRVVGPLPFDAVGIVSSIARPLATALIPVIVVSTYETDYVLIRDTDFDPAIMALRGAQIQIDGT